MKFRTKLAIWMSAVLICISSATVMVFFGRAHHVQRESLRSRLIGIATTGAMMVDSAKLDRLRTAMDEMRPEYTEVKATLRTIMNNSGVRGIYTMRRGAAPDVYEFIVDPQEDVDRNNNGVLEPSERYPRIGERYSTERYPEMQKAFEAPTADREISSDRWGTWLSGYAPIYDSSHQPIAILGVDMAADDVKKEERTLEVMAIATIALAAFLSIVSSFFLAHRLTRPLGQLSHALAEVARGNLQTKLPREGADEFAQLALSFNDMSAALVQARDEIDAQQRLLERRIAEKTDELARTREAAIESEKLAALGTFAGGIAHEFNNIICAVRGQVDLAAMAPTPERIRQAAETVSACAERSRRITDALQTFSRRGPFRVFPTDIQKAVETALDLFKHDLNTLNITVFRKFSDVDTIGAEPERLVQAFGSVIGNARDAMRGKGGRLTVIIRPIDQDIEISFRDTGPGIRLDSLPHLFEPFFTTKGPLGSDLTAGTGLGLAVAQGVVKNHGGAITAENNDEGGATIRIRLPVRPWPGKGTRPTLKRRPLLASRKLLVVDDEPDILSAVRDILLMRGWEVTTASSGDEALELAARSQFPLFLVDIAIPGISGIDLIRRLREMNEDAVFVVISGFALDQLAARFTNDEVAAFVSKPFRVAELIATLDSMAPPPEASS